MAIAIFLTCIALGLYIVVGYPALLLGWSCVRRRPVIRRFEPLTVTIILPVHDGAPWIEAKLQSLLELDYPASLLRILLVDDGSTDDTVSRARTIAGDAIEIISQAALGKPAALNLGIAASRSAILFFTDVRQTLAKDSVRRLVERFADPSVGVVSGQLVIRDGVTHEESAIGRYWQYELRIRERLSSIGSLLGATGCIYAMRRELAVKLPPEILVDDMYLPLAAYRRGYRIVLETSALAFDYPTELHSEFYRKVRTLAGNYQILKAYPGLLLPWRRGSFHFLSHKAGRLLLPFLALAAGLASFGLPSPWRWAPIGTAACVLGAAVLDGWVAETGFAKRLTSPAKTLVTLLFAAAYALFAFQRGDRNLWRRTRVRRLPRSVM